MRGTLATARDWFVDRAYALGWALVCRVPESWGRWVFQQAKATTLGAHSPLWRLAACPDLTRNWIER